MARSKAVAWQHRMVAEGEVVYEWQECSEERAKAIRNGEMAKGWQARSLVTSGDTAPAQPRPMVPEARITPPLYPDECREEQYDSAAYDRGWNDCRKAMLAAAPVAGESS